MMSLIMGFCIEKCVSILSFFGLMIFLVWADLKYLILPEALNFGLLWMGLWVNLKGIWTSTQSSILGAGLGYGILWLLYWGFKKLTGKEGLGYGDFKLMAALGAWFGATALPNLLLMAGLIGLGFGLVWRKLSDQGPEFPFGPALLVAGFLQFFRH